MLFNIKYVDESGELNTCAVNTTDVKMAIRETFLSYPDATRILECTAADLDNLGESN
tara:strand:- start:9632 stop:9802 length:171 start_codon:yes stop_codon:yes gene_type:complete